MSRLVHPVYYLAIGDNDAMDVLDCIFDEQQGAIDYVNEHNAANRRKMEEDLEKYPPEHPFYRSIKYRLDHQKPLWSTRPMLTK